MIEHAPKKEPHAVRPRPASKDDDLLEEGLEESFPASDTPSALQPHPSHPRPVWDQRPETD